MRLSIIIGLSLIWIGCGVYTFTGRGIAGIETVAVEPFDNETSEFGIRDDITDALLTRLLSDRTLTLAEPRTADAVLRGTVVDVDDRPFTFDENENVTEYRIRITVEVSLVHPGRSEAIWEARLVGKGNYPYDNGTPDERQEGIDKAINQLVQDLINRLTSDW